MKRIVLAIVVIIGGLTSNAQSGFGTINIRAGGNASVAATFLEVDYGIAKDYDSSAIAAAFIPVSVDLFLTKFLSVGASYKSGTWLDEDTQDDNLEVTKKKVADYNLGVKLFPVNKDNFNFYVGADYGLSTLEKDVETKVIVVKQHQKWSGTGLGLHLGFNAYFGSNFGIYMQTGYTQRNYSLKEYSVNNVDALLASTTYDLLTKGGFLELGFAFKIGIKN